MRKEIKKSYHPIQCPGTYKIINHSKHHLFFRQKKRTTQRTQPVDSDKNFFKMKSSRSSLISQKFPRSAGGSVSSPSNTWPTEPVSSAANSWHQVKGTKPGPLLQTSSQVRAELHPHLWTIILEMWALNGH